MSEESNIWTAVGGAFVGLATGAAAFGEWLRRKRIRSAADDAEIASIRASTAASSADENIYRRMIDRLTSAEEEIRQVRQELSAMRRQIRHAEDHIAELQRALRDAGIQFTPYEPLQLKNTP